MFVPEGFKRAATIGCPVFCNALLTWAHGIGLADLLWSLPMPKPHEIGDVLCCPPGSPDRPLLPHSVLGTGEGVGKVLGHLAGRGAKQRLRNIQPRACLHA